MDETIHKGVDALKSGDPLGPEFEHADFWNDRLRSASARAKTLGRCEHRELVLGPDIVQCRVCLKQIEHSSELAHLGGMAFSVLKEREERERRAADR